MHKFYNQIISNEVIWTFQTKCFRIDSCWSKLKKYQYFCVKMCACFTTLTTIIVDSKKMTNLLGTNNNSKKKKENGRRIKKIKKEREKSFVFYFLCDNKIGLTPSIRHQNTHFSNYGLDQQNPQIYFFVLFATTLFSTLFLFFPFRNENTFFFLLLSSTKGFFVFFRFFLCWLKVEKVYKNHSIGRRSGNKTQNAE